MAPDASRRQRVAAHATAAGTLAGALVGGVFLAWIAGTGPLDPTNIDWAMKLDWAEHVFGWHFFRTEPWQWPPGAIHGYFAPLGTSVGLTDSIPLAAYLLKPFDRWLPPLVQYLGPWWLLCFVLQGALGARLTSRATSSAVAQTLGGTLFVLLPTLLARVGHAALCSHWLLLWALLIATRPPSTRTRLWEWATLGLIAGMVMPYLAIMVLALLLGPALRRSESGGAGVQLAALGAAVAATVLGWWLSGMFVLSGAGALTEGGLGYFSMNLLAPISPTGWSRFLPELPVASEGQTYEGFQYLGLGVLGLAVLAAGLSMRPARPANGPPVRYGAWLVTGAALMAAFALSPHVTLGAWTVVDVNGPWFGPLAAFRSSGRFAWPLTYLALTWMITTVLRRLRPGAATAVLAAAIVVQLVDLSSAHRQRYDTAHSAAFYAWTQPFVSDRWTALVAGRTHLVVVPPPQCGAGSPVPYEPVLRLAATHHLTANVGAVSRVDAGARDRYCADLQGAVSRGALDPQSLYVVAAPMAERVNAAAGSGGTCAMLDSLWVCGTALAMPPP